MAPPSITKNLRPVKYYTPRETDGDINVPHTNPLKEFAVLLGGLLGILLLIYIAAGLAVNFVADRMPASADAALGKVFSQKYASGKRTPVEQYLQGIVNGLDGEGRYTVHVVNSPAVNAMAVPGGTIIVLSGLIKQAKSENELAFVLGHEIGHFKDHDHLKALGRTLVLVAISSTVLGADNDVTKFFMNSLTTTEMRFSQKQETAADLTALDLLNKRYGHVGGGTAFLEKMAHKDPRGRLTYFFASHPYPPDRIQDLKERIKEKGYTIGNTVPLPDFVKNYQDFPAPGKANSTPEHDPISPDTH
jgi:Zn-dependent protease with chaperone function